MIPKTAFILGNGPSLPVDRLEILAGQFTIGCNRILRSGFCPSVVLWCDNTVYDDEGEQLEQSAALLVTGKGQRKKPHHIGLSFAPPPKDNGDPSKLFIRGNSGAAAARWASALGAERMYLLGMGASYDGERTDFYGSNRYHGKTTLEVLQRELSQLLKDYSGRAIRSDDPGVWKPSREQNQSAIRYSIIYKLRAKGLDFDYTSNVARGYKRDA